MNREQKAAAIAEIAEQLQDAEAIFAVDYRGISVSQSVTLRSSLRDADATFRVVKNTLTERAADQAGVEALKEHLEGPTALTFVRGDAAAAAKVIADFQRASGAAKLLPFKGGVMGQATLSSEQVTAIAKLPSRDVLMGQLVGVVAAPITGLARGLNGLLSGLAVALGGVLEKKESGEVPSGTSLAGSAGAEHGDAADASSGEIPAGDSASDTPADDAPDASTPDPDADAPDAGATPHSEDPAEGPATPETE